jgi:hypothetical protein
MDSVPVSKHDAGTIHGQWVDTIVTVWRHQFMMGQLSMDGYTIVSS